MASNWNLFCERLAAAGLSQREAQVVAVIARKTLGWRRDSDRISTTQIERQTGIPRHKVSEMLLRLETRGVITRVGGCSGRASTINLNLHVEWAKPVPVEGRVQTPKPVPVEGQVSECKPVPVRGAKPVPVEGHTIDKGLKKAAADAAALAQNELRQRAFDAWRESAGQVLNAKERGALAQQVTALAKSGSDGETILAAVRSLGRNREFPGFLTARVNEIEATGGVCRHDGRDRRVLSVAELERCGCGRCREWLDRKRVAA